MNKNIEHKSPPIKSKKQKTKIADPEKRKRLISLSIILLISFLIYIPVLGHGFLRWDDDKYLQNNPLIFTINFKAIFSSYVWGNYHPLTILVYALEYLVFGLNAKGFHVVNLLIHLFNVALVFYAVLFLSEKTEVAILASLLFGIHPIHVESVAWIAEMKDLLYALFFLLSYIYYLKYLKQSDSTFYYSSILFFLLSLLSKGMAASLPMLLILTDYFKGRKMDKKAWIEKMPFFVLAIIFGLVAIFAQQSTNSIQDITFFPYLQRIVFACYSYVTYLVKLVFPINLCAFYPYPMKSGAGIPVWYYAYPILFLSLAAVIIYSLRFSKKIIFAAGFFSITVFLVLQLLPVGGAIMADRYAYIPSIGIFYLASEGFYRIRNKKVSSISLRSLVAAVLIAFLIFFCIKTYLRSEVWKDDKTLWNDVISRYQNIPRAYTNRGNVYMEEQNYEAALTDFNKALELQPNFAEVYMNRGSMFMNLNKTEEALNDFNKAIELKPGFLEAYHNRGVLLINMEKYEDALKDCNKIIAINPVYGNAYINRGNIYMKQDKFDEAQKDFNHAIELMPSYAVAWYNRAILLMNEKRYEEALRDYSRTIELDSKSVEAYYYRALIEYNTDRKEMACGDLQQAATLGYQPAADAFNQFCK